MRKTTPPLWHILRYTIHSHRPGQPGLTAEQTAAVEAHNAGDAIARLTRLTPHAQTVEHIAVVSEIRHYSEQLPDIIVGIGYLII